MIDKQLPTDYEKSLIFLTFGPVGEETRREQNCECLELVRACSWGDNLDDQSW